MRVGETIDASVAKFVDVGLAIAIEYPDVKDEMEQAAEEAKESGRHRLSLVWMCVCSHLVSGQTLVDFDNLRK